MTIQNALCCLFVVAIAGCNGTEDTADSSGPAPGGGGGGGGGTLDEKTVAAVFAADNDFDGDDQFYAVSYEGGIMQISRSFGDDHHVNHFKVTPDQQSVVFGVENAPESGLYIAAINSETALRLSPPGSMTVKEIAISPDGTWIAYRGEASPVQLYVVRPDGSGHASLSLSVSSNVQWSFDGTWLGYRSDRAVENQQEIYVVRPDGTGDRRVSQTASAAGDFGFAQFSWSPTENCVAFNSDALAPTVYELWTADIDAGATAVQVSVPVGTSAAIGWTWSPDGSELTYTRKDDSTGNTELFLVSKGGGDARRVSGGQASSVRAHEWSRDGSMFAFHDGSEVWAGDGQEPSAMAASAHLVLGIEPAPDGDKVAYLARRAGVSTTDLYIADDLGTVRVSPDGADFVDMAWDVPPPAVPNQTSLAQIVPSNLTGAHVSGIAYYPGIAPLYRNGELIGGLGISGDGVDQDDIVVHRGTPYGGPRGSAFSFGMGSTYLSFPVISVVQERGTTMIPDTTAYGAFVGNVTRLRDIQFTDPLKLVKRLQNATGFGGLYQVAFAGQNGAPDFIQDFGVFADTGIYLQVQLDTAQRAVTASLSQATELFEDGTPTGGEYSRIRYDSPPVRISSAYEFRNAATGQTSEWEAEAFDVELRYANEFGGIRVAGGSP